MQDIVVGQLVLISNNVLCRVERIDSDGFAFECVNGAWDGYFSQTDKTVRVAGKDIFPAEIVSSTQPPPEIGQGWGYRAYNAIIPWMDANR